MEIIGDYELLEKIAEGGMGAVYKARHTQNGDFAAVKIVPEHLTKNVVLLKRFEQEYNAARSLDHPNIVRALEFGYFGPCPYLAMEYVEGESLGKLLERKKSLPEVEAISIITQVAQGLSKAHKQGMVHRDVKPDNILINKQGTAKLADLGLVKELETDTNLTRTGRGLGTPHFMAPEQFRNAKNVDARSDIYSLAATLYMMVTGELPFKALRPLEAWMKKIENKLKSAREIVPELSERVDFAIRRAMLADPDLRQSHCQEFIEDLTGHSTRRIAPISTDPNEQNWYLRYTDEEGVSHTVRGSLISIRRSLKEGLLGRDAGNIRAARDKAGPYDQLKNLPEFRDLVLSSTVAAAQATDKISPPAPPGAPAGKGPMARKAAARPSPASAAANGPPRYPETKPPRRARVRAAAPAPRKPGRPVPESPRRAVPAPATAVPVPVHLDMSHPPHVIFDAPRKETPWTMIVFLAVLALVAGLSGFFLLPQFLR